MKQNLIKSVILSVILFIGVSNAWGNVVGVIGKDLDQYTVKLNVCREDGSWVTPTPTMRKTTMTYNGKHLYQASFSYSSNSNNITCMQIQLWDGNTHKGEKVLFTSKTNHNDFYGYVFDYDNNGQRLSHVASFRKEARLYFDATGWNETDIKLCIGHGYWQTYYPMNRIANTNLYYGNPVDGWADAIGICVVGNTKASNNGQGFMIDVATNAKECTGLRDWSLNAVEDNNAYLMVNKGKSGEQPEMSYYESHYDTQNGLNSTQTVKYSISENGTTYSTLNSGTTPAKISVSSYKFTDRIYNQVSPETKTLSEGSSTYSQQFIAAHTATTKLTVGNIETGYRFDGWYDTRGTQLSTSETYTYRPTSATTVYARFTKIYNISIIPNNANYGNVLPTSLELTASSNGTIKATPNIGYAFTNWTATDGITITNANNVSTTITATKAGTVTANFEARPSTTIYLEPRNEYWNKDDAKFVAHVWNAQNQIADIPMSGVGDGPKYRYYTCEIPYGYTNVVFFRQDPSGNTLWNKTADQDIPEGNRVLYTITDPGKGESNGYTPAASGEWKVADLVYTINLIGTQYGSYTVQYNEDQIYTIGEENKIIDIPANTQLTITNITPDEGYDKTIRYKRDGDIYRQFSQTENITYIVNSDLLIEEDFRVATEGNILYIKVDGYETFKYWCAENNDYGPQIKFINDDEQSAIVSYNSMKETSQYNLYEYIIPSGYHSFYIYPHGSTDASQLFDHEIIRSDYKNCYKLKDKNPTASTGEWIGATITLGYTDIGRFGVRYNGETVYEDKAKREDGNRNATYIYVPYGAEIEVLAGEPGNDAFVNSMVYIDQTTDEKTKLDFTEQTTSYTFTVKGDVKVDDLFGTKQDYIIYIGIPKNEDGSIQEEFKDWDLACTDPNHNKGDQMYIWCHWPYSGFGLSGDEYYGSDELIQKIDEIYTDEKYLFYQYKLPKGVYTFNFQCKENKEKDNTDPAHATSIFHYNPPLTIADCFILTGDKDDDGQYSGYWTSMPSHGDFRILYVEQIVTKKEKVGDEWITEVKRTYEHSSDLIKPSELNTNGKKIVSLHIYTRSKNPDDTRGKNPEIILQKYDGEQKKWIDIEAHMVNGPLETDDPGMGLLPGRKNATPGSDIDDFVYDDGIEKIKNDPTDDGCGVWNFTVYANGESAKLNLISDDGLKRYTGKYYIRTDNAEGQWIDYKKPTNYMTFSSYAKKNSGFSHYFCKWVDTKQHYQDVSFIVANDYAQSLTDPSYLFKDQYVDNQWLPENANVRWGWDIVTNKVSRAYIQGTWTTAEPPARLDNIVLKYKQSGTDIDSKDILLHDSGDWIYAVNLDNMQVGAYLNSLTAQYPKTGNTQYFAKDIEMLTGESSNKNKYVVRVQYDFKIDHTLIALLPNNQEANIGIDVVIERIDQKDATQVQASVNSQKRVTQEDGSTLTGSTVYGVFTFTKTFLTDNTLENQERFTHWFSFPFDVKLSDVFGFSPVGDYWMIRKYNGDKRAAEGLNETNTFWEYERNSEAILKANTGYILVLSTNLKYEDRDIYINRDTLSLYFPATDLVTSINSDYFETPVEVPQHKNQNTTLKDWNWNMIGMPSYANKQETIKQDHLYYFYDYSHKNNSYEVVWSGEKSFKSTFAYMVQFAGTIDWKGFYFTKAQGLAPRERTDEEIQKHVLRLDLHRAGAREDKTYIQLIDENATTDFDMNLDLTKMLNSSKSNLYSLLQNYKLAANVLPIEEAIIPLGVVTTTAGEYTFAMPNGTDGIVVELIDYETNTRTNMLLDNYTVNLGKGTFENRFALHVKPDKTTTSVDNLGNEATGDKVKKYLIDGVLYMQKDGVLYDAQGRKL